VHFYARAMCKRMLYFGDATKHHIAVRVRSLALSASISCCRVSAPVTCRTAVTNSSTWMSSIADMSKATCTACYHIAGAVYTTCSAMVGVYASMTLVSASA
jgi:hypothetical protein